jgi:iron complex outermembrane recepter protein
VKTSIPTRSRLARALTIALMTTAPAAFAAAEQEEPTADSDGDQRAELLQRVEVTGSRIRRVDAETAEPLLVITRQDIEQQGFANLFDTLSNLTVNTGLFVGEEITNNFNANAQALNLRGLGPNYTLVLINGRRVPVLPKPSGPVAGNVTNLAMIPTSAVERIEILSGGASAIYGSDAVAGVVNVILRDRIEDTTFDYRYGDTRHGGGRSDRASLVSGFVRGDTRVSGGIEWDRRQPIRGDQRRWFDHPERSPHPDYRALSQVMSYWDRASGWEILDISDLCTPLGYEAVRPGWAGPGAANYCGDNAHGTYTIRNARDRLFGFANVSHAFGDHDAYLRLLATRSDADAGISRYGYNVDYQIVDDIDAAEPQTLGWRHLWRAFRQDEVPTSEQSFAERNHSVATGLSGPLGNFDYGLHLSYGQYRYRDSIGRFNDQAMLGLLFGQPGVDWIQPWAGSRWVRVGANQVDDRLLPSGGLDLFGPLSPEMFADALHHSIGDGRSSAGTVAAELTGRLFELPAGAVEFAGVIEANRATYRFLTDQPTVDGEIFGWSGIRGRGSRNHYAIGGELLLPLAARGSGIGAWEAKLAARHDWYDDASDVGGAFTYQLGLTWRPLDSLMLRASRATSFRAPDMHVMFAERSSSFISGVDFLRCVQGENLPRGQSWEGCRDGYGTGSIRQFSQGDPGLREERGSATGLGLVAQIGRHHSLTADLYRLELEDQIGLIGASTVLRYYAECQLGWDEQGQDVDPQSPRCQAMLSRVVRGGPNDVVTAVVTSPFNTGLRRQDGVDVSWQSTIPTARFGLWSARLSWTHVLRTQMRYLPEDEIEDIRDRLWNSEFRSRTNATLGWSGGPFSTYLHINRLGSSPVRWTELEYERYRPWTTVNLSLDYRVTDALSFGLNVVNLFDREPPLHASERWWPYADVRKYNPVGAEYFVSVRYRL